MPIPCGRIVRAKSRAGKSEWKGKQTCFFCRTTFFGRVRFARPVFVPRSSLAVDFFPFFPIRTRQSHDTKRGRYGAVKKTQESAGKSTIQWQKSYRVAKKKSMRQAPFGRDRVDWQKKRSTSEERESLVVESDGEREALDAAGLKINVTVVLVASDLVVVVVAMLCVDVLHDSKTHASIPCGVAQIEQVGGPPPLCGDECPTRIDGKAAARRVLVIDGRRNGQAPTCLLSALSLPE